MRARRRYALCCGLGLMLPALSRTARAEQGFALDRFDPAESGGVWFAADALEFSGHNRWALGVVGDLASEPLVARDAGGNELARLIAAQSFLHAGASAVFYERLRVGVQAPLLAFQRTSSLRVENASIAPEAGAALGDVRLGADVRLVGAPHEPFSFAAGLRLYLPTGSREAFVSDGALRAMPQLAAAGELGSFVYAASTGVQVRRGPSDFAGERGGSELMLTAAAGVRTLQRRLTVGPEFWGASALAGGSNGFLQRASTPFEVVLGAHYDVMPDLRVAFGIGPGLSEGLGSPALRGLAALEWAPEAAAAPVHEAPPDSDADGVIDPYDRCPTTFGSSLGEPGLQGCPELDIATDLSAEAPPAMAPATLPAPPAVLGAIALPDRDGDGVLDEFDACPDAAGLEDRLAPSGNGCPVPPGAEQADDGEGVISNPPDANADAAPTDEAP